MAVLPNPYGPASPMGQSMAQLMNTLFTPTGGVDPTKQAYNRAAAAKLQAETNALYRKQNAMSRIGNVVQDMVTGELPEAPRPSPEFEGPMPAISRDQYVADNVGDLTRAAIRAGFNPEQAGQLAFQTARQANLPADIVSRYSPDFLPLNKGVTLADRDAMIEAENAAKLNRAVRTEQAKPVNIGEGDIALFPPGDPRGSGRVEGLPTINTQRGLVAQQARESGTISPIDRQILGGSQGTPRNYLTPTGQQGVTLDGINDAATGVPIPPGSTVFTGQLQTGNIGDLTKKTISGLQSDELSATRFKSLLSQTRDLAGKDPTNFGIPGFVKGVAQDVTQVGKGLAVGLGYQGVDEAVADVRSRVARSGVNPSLVSGVFDPNLPALHTLADLLVFSAAETLAGQEGRSVSDRDVKMFKQIAGDPKSWLTSQEKYLAKLKIMEDIINGRMNATQQFTDKHTGKSAEQPDKPGAVIKWGRDADGNPTRLE